MSPTQTFINTLSQTPVQAQALLANLNRLKANLAQIIKILNYSKTVDDDLAKLDNALDTTKNVLTVVSVIPEVGEAAIELKNAVTILSQEVKPARQAADRIEKVVKPIRDALVKVQSLLDQFIAAVQKIYTTSSSFLHNFTAVVNCINSLPDGTYKTQGLNYLNEFSSTAQPGVAGLNQAMSTANSVIDAFYNQLQALANALNPLGAIASAIEQVLNTLNPVLNVLSQLENALQNIKITIPIPYPVSVSLYDIFKEFGMFIDLAMKPIQDLINQVLNALHIKLPSIPGLDILLNLHINVPTIPGFQDLLNAINNFFNQIANLIPSFTLACPPKSKDDQAPNGGHFVHK
jgi:archaellum component FlaC